MVVTPSTALRRFAGFAFALVLLSFCLAGQALGQVIATAPQGLTHPSGWGAIQGTALDSNGNWLVADYANGGLYEFPANGGAAITLVAPGGLTYQGGLASYTTPFVFLDPGNNLYASGSYNNCLLMFPYGSAAGPWPGLSTVSTGNPAGNDCGNAPYSFADGFPYINFSPYYFQPWSLALGQGALADNIVIGSNNSNMIFALPITGAWSNPVPTYAGLGYGGSTGIITGMTARPRSLATDPVGNIYIVEDSSQTSSALPGVLEIPASSIVVNNGGFALSSDSGLVRVDPGLPNVTGVVTDAAGNLYISDGTQGVYEVPNPSGTPQTSSAILLSPVPAQGQVSIDTTNDILYIPTSQTQNNGEADVAKIVFNGSAEFGSSTVGVATSANPTPVTFLFRSAATPSAISVVEDGVGTPDFSISGGTCTAGTEYGGSGEAGYCTANVVFTPSTVGSVSAKLVMQSASGTLSFITLHGTGTGANINAAPSVTATIGSGLKTPSQIAVDAVGNTYVADSGLAKVQEFAVGSSTAVALGTGTTAPTGVAVDGAGDIFIADSGSVYEIPYGTSGLTATAQTTLTTGLGTNVRLAVDGNGSLYAADPSNARVVVIKYAGGPSTGAIVQSISYLTSGFTAPSDVATDSNNNLYVLDGENLFEYSGGTLTTLLNSLSGATDIAVDAAGSVYLTSSAATVRIPLVSGALSTASETTIDTATGRESVVLDRAGDVYLVSAGGSSITELTNNGVLDFGTFTSDTQEATLNATVANTGNQPLTVTAYTDTNTLDYTAADGTCISGSPVAAGGTCSVDVTLNPGPGDQGTLTSQIGFTSNAANSTVGISATGVGATLANSTTTVTVGAGAEAVNTTVTITVAPSPASSTVPTGTVTITYLDPTGATQTVTGTLGANGTFTTTLSPVHGGSETFTAQYQGDRTYGRSSGTLTTSIAKSAVTMAYDTAPPTYLPYTLSNANGFLPYDGSANYWSYNWPVTVTAKAGIPTGTVSFNNGSALACPANAGDSMVNLPASGLATFQTQCLPIPQNSSVNYYAQTATITVTPVYSGDDSFQGFTGNPETFIAVNTPSVMMSSSPASVSITAGTPASVALTITSPLGYGYGGKNQPENNYTFPISLVCAGLPPRATCSYTYATPDANTPGSTDINCTGTATQTTSTVSCTPVQASITINTNVDSGITTTDSKKGVHTAIRNGRRIGLSFLIGFGMLGIFYRRKVGVYGNYLLALGITMILFGATACSTKDLSPQAILTTPKGTYQVQVYAIEVGSETITSVTPPVTLDGSEDPVSVPLTIPVTVQ